MVSILFQDVEVKIMNNGQSTLDGRQFAAS